MVVVALLVLLGLLLLLLELLLCRAAAAGASVFYGAERLSRGPKNPTVEITKSTSYPNPFSLA